jgi:protein O-mannosyl-transferase
MSLDTPPEIHEGTQVRRENSGRAARVPILLCMLLVAAVTAAPYLSTLRYGLVLDDDPQIVKNPAVHNWASLPRNFVVPLCGLVESNRTAEKGQATYYRPLFCVWLTAGYTLFGTNAAAWHAATVGLHVAVTLLLFQLLFWLVKDYRAATAGALIFGVHPAHIESVAWISAAPDLLAALALLGVFLVYNRSLDSPPLWRSLAAHGLYAAALLSKEPAVFYAPIAFLYELARGDLAPEMQLAERIVRAIRRTGLFFLMAIAYSFVRVELLLSTRPLVWVSRHDAVLTAPSILVFYLRHLVWPARLSYYYDLPIITSAASPGFWMPILILAAICIAGWFPWSKSRSVAIPWAAAWLFLPLLPVLNVAFFWPYDYFHDRYLYLPSIGLAILVALAFNQCTPQDVPDRRRLLATAFAAVVVVAFAFSTAIQSTPWQSGISMFTYAVQSAPGNAMAKNNLGTQYIEKDRLEEAEAIFREALSQHPDFWLGTYNLGYTYYKEKRYELAETYFRRAIALDPDDPDQHAYLGIAYFHENRLADAVSELVVAIRRRPEGYGYHATLGLLLEQGGRPDQARLAFLEELKYHPDNEIAKTQLARLGAGTPTAK